MKDTVFKILVVKFMWIVLRCLILNDNIMYFDEDRKRVETVLKDMEKLSKELEEINEKF